MAQPPNTAIATPERQAIGNLQSGFGGLMPSLAGAAPSRAELGLPDRSTYFPGMPSLDEVKGIGGLPPVRPPGLQPGEKKKIKTGKEIR